MIRLFRVLAISAGGLLICLSAHAANLYWVGAAGGSPATASNWRTTDPSSCGGGNASAAPGASDTAIFDPDCDNNATMTADWTV